MKVSHLLGVTKKEKASSTLFIAIFLVYAIISMSKNAYAAAMVSIIDEGIFTKSSSGIINAAFYVFYGVAQLLGMKLVDKLSPVILVYISVLGAAISCVGMALSDSFYMMLFLWSFSGLVQFAIWPSVLRIISEYLIDEHKKRAMIYIGFGYCAGTLLNYFVAAIVLKFSNWRMLFVCAALFLLLVSFIWNIASKKAITVCYENAKSILITQTKQKSEDERSTKQNFGYMKLLFTGGIFMLLIPSFLRSALDNGLKLWVPTMIKENYSVSPSFASMLTTILVFVNMFGVFIAGRLYPKYTKNTVLAYALCFSIALPFTALLIFVGKIPVLLVVLLLTAVTTMMYAAHQLVNVVVPGCFAKYGKSGSCAAILNAVASFGIVWANIIFGLVAENHGWTKVTLLWIILLCVATLFSFAASPIWAKFMRNSENN